MRASTLRRAVERYYETMGFQPLFPKGGIRCGNCLIDGKVREGAWLCAIELKSDSDDLMRGLGQFLEALSHGYDMALLVTSQSRVERLDANVFHTTGIGLAAVNSRGELTFIAEPKIVKF